MQSNRSIYKIYTSGNRVLDYNTYRMNDKIMVLAAGNSSRLGKNKQLLTIDGVNLVQRTLNCCKSAAIGSISLVIGFESDKLLSKISTEGINIVHNKKWDEGMGESIGAAARSLPEETTGVYIVLPDQINLTPAILQSIHQKSTQHPDSIIVSRYGEDYGAPSYFPSIFFDALRKCEGRIGAKKLVEENISVVEYVDFENGDVDIDRPEDLHLVD